MGRSALEITELLWCQFRYQHPGVGLTPQKAEESQPPQKLRLERGKEANDSQFPLESHFFTTIVSKKKSNEIFEKSRNKTFLVFSIP